MNSTTKRNKSFWFLFIPFLLLFFLIKYAAPTVIQYFYHHDIILLQKIVHNVEPHPVEYYLGEIERLFYGPLMNVIAGMLFLSVCWQYLKTASILKFFLAVLTFLLVVKWEILFYPPYGGDAITAVFKEAIWLAENKLNYIGLFHEADYLQGGARVYFTSVFPGFLALQLLIFPTAIFLFLNHLYVFIFAAVIVTLLRDLCRRIWNDEIGLLIALVLLFMPVFWSQIEMINMEMTCLFFTFLSAYFLCQKSFAKALIFGLVAQLVKGPGAIAGSSVFVVCLLLFLFSDKYRRDWRVLMWGAAAIVLTVLHVFWTNTIHNKNTVIGFIKPFAGVIAPHTITTVFIFCLVLFVPYAVHRIVDGFRDKKNGLSEFLEHHYVPLVLFTYAAMYFMLYLNFNVMLTRYKLLAYPFMVFCVSYSVSLIIKSHVIQRSALVAVMMITLFFSYGLFEQEQANFHYIQIERTLEYRSVLKRDLALAHEIEQRYANFTIVAPPVVANILAFPELGYVHKQLNVQVYGLPSVLKRLPLYTGFKSLNLFHTIWIAYQDDLADEWSAYFPYPIDPRDKVLNEIVYGDKQAYIFMGGFAIERLRLLSKTIKSQRYFGQARDRAPK